MNIDNKSLFWSFLGRHLEMSFPQYHNQQQSRMLLEVAVGDAFHILLSALHD
jgi:hypothetical protein